MGHKFIPRPISMVREQECPNRLGLDPGSAAELSPATAPQGNTRLLMAGEGRTDAGQVATAEVPCRGPEVYKPVGTQNRSWSFGSEGTRLSVVRKKSKGLGFPWWRSG